MVARWASSRIPFKGYVVAHPAITRDSKTTARSLHDGLVQRGDPDVGRGDGRAQVLGVQNDAGVGLPGLASALAKRSLEQGLGHAGLARVEDQQLHTPKARAWTSC